ncbi:hypothetical protein AHAS_Ahas02G0161700 [Arachis hypogaea]
MDIPNNTSDSEALPGSGGFNANNQWHSFFKLLKKGSQMPFQPFHLLKKNIPKLTRRKNNVIGEGGYAEVYLGKLEDGTFVAIKKLTRGNQEEMTADFLSELGIICCILSLLNKFCLSSILHKSYNLMSSSALSKAGNVDVLNCYYAHGEDNENFQRQLEHIVLIYYRDIKERYKSGISHSPAAPVSLVGSSQTSSVPSSVKIVTYN